MEGGGDHGPPRLLRAALHDRAARAEETEWPHILGLYALLEQLTGNPVVTLNKTVAAGMAEGPEAGLAVLESVGERLAGHYRLDPVRAHLLEQAGDAEAARKLHRNAAARATNLAEQRHLALRAARLRKEEDASVAARWVRRTA